MITDNADDYTLKIYRVLVVEDSEADFELYQRYFAKDEVYHYQISHAETAREALKLFAEQDFDFILVDFSLPDMTGLKLIEAMKNSAKSLHVPVMMMTGQGSEAIALQAIKQNIYDYFVKGNLNFSGFISGIYRVINHIESQGIGYEDRIIDILIVEDSEVDLDMYKRFLEQDQDTRFNIYEADTGRSALYLLTNKKVDIILVDYNLPDMNGIDLIKTFKALNQSDDTTIVMMTAVGNEQLVISAIKAGISDYLLKNALTSESLRQSIKDSILKKRLSSEINKSQFQKNALSRIGLKIRQSINLHDIFNTSAIEVKKYLQSNRVVVYQLSPDGEGSIVGEAVDAKFSKSLGLKITDTFFADPVNREQVLDGCHQHIVNDVSKSNLDPCLQNFLETLQIKSVISVPIIIDNASNLWGLLIAHFCRDIHFWEKDEIYFLNEIAFHVSIAVEQGLLVEQLKQERDRANAATRAKSAFLANMSHEIRTPMNGILGMAEMLSMSDLNDDDRECVTIIQKSGENLLSLIKDILDLSKLEASKIRFESIEFSLKDIVAELKKSFRVAVAEKSLIMDFDISQDLPDSYLGDPYRLKQILINLISNAIKFTKEGNIAVTIKRSQINSDLDNGAANDEVSLYCSVQDSGIGIPLEKQYVLFKPFSQVDDSTTRNYGGSGLGLAICKQLVDLMDGEIGVESNHNQGSTFWFSVKLKSVNSLASKDSLNQDMHSNETSIQKARILVVEDNLTNQKVIRIQLQKLGYSFHIVEDGKQALEVLNQNSYDLILMDCHMPVLDGYDTTRAIRQNEKTRNIAVIGVTAFAMSADREKCINAGMNDYLSKPVTIASLQQAIEKWI